MTLNDGWYYKKIKLVEKFKQFPGITPLLDNSVGRKTNAIIFAKKTPQFYGERIIFINARNEWTEENYDVPFEKWVTNI